MKIIFKIAKTELRNLFYSPVAWFLVIVFLVQCAIPFTKILYLLAHGQDINLKNTPNWHGFDVTLTKTVFVTGGLVRSAFQNLYLFIPLLTMGIMSREINTGTIKLLYSSPIKLREIILGKYLAITIFNILLLVIFSLFIITGAVSIRSIDYGLLLSISLGFYLLICAYTAIGLFMSSLTTYQIISGIGTFIVVFILSNIGTLWQKYDFVRDLTYFLSIAGRTENMLKGLITTKDVIYFLVIIYIFICFTFLKLKGGRESRPWSTVAFRYIMVVISALCIGYLSSRPAVIGYWDTTACKLNTLHPRTQEIIKELDDRSPLEVTLYGNLLGEGLAATLPEARNTYLTNLWEPYLRFKPDIKFKYVYYHYYDGSLDKNSLYNSYPRKTEKEIAAIMADMYQLDTGMFLSPDRIRKIIDPNLENGRAFMSIKYKGRTATLRTFLDPQFWPDETQIDDVLKQLIQTKHPKIYFLTGHLERDIHKLGEREYSRLSIDKNRRNSLINHSFSSDTLSLENREIPADINAMVIADPKTKFSPTALNRIQQYIDKGGNLLIFGEPGKQDVLNPLIKPLGVQLRNGTLVEVSKNETPDKVISEITASGSNLSEEDFLLALKESIRTKSSTEIFRLYTPGAMTFSYITNGPYTITPILTTLTENQPWLKMGKVVLDSVPPVFSPAEGDLKDPVFSTAVQLTRQVNNKQQRIIICGDADFTNNMRLDGNIFGNAFYSWLAYGKYPQYLPLLYHPKDISLTITGPTASVIKTVYVWVLPGLILAAGIILLIRRKRK